MLEAALERMKTTIGGDPQVLAEIIKSFIDEVETMLPAFDRAAAASDTQTIARIAHTIKASARDFGDLTLAELCASLEHDAKAGLQVLNARVDEVSKGCRALSVRLLAAIEKGL